MTEKKDTETLGSLITVTLGSKRSFGNWKIFLHVGGLAMPVVISKRNYRTLMELGVPEEG